jgi:aspartate ammonia-lyase
MEYRMETELLGPKKVPAQALYGIHTARALENFPLTDRPLRKVVIGDNLLTEKQFDALISPEAVLRMGSPDEYFTRKDAQEDEA